MEGVSVIPDDSSEITDLGNWLSTAKTNGKTYSIEFAKNMLNKFLRSGRAAAMNSAS